MINDHIYVTNIITVIKTQEGQMINTDEETSNENLQKKVNHCVGNFEKAFKIIKKVLLICFLMDTQIHHARINGLDTFPIRTHQESGDVFVETTLNI